jgi:hypothetical protein
MRIHQGLVKGQTQSTTTSALFLPCWDQIWEMGIREIPKVKVCSPTLKIVDIDITSCGCVILLYDIDDIDSESAVVRSFENPSHVFSVERTNLLETVQHMRDLVVHGKKMDKDGNPNPNPNP